MSDQETETRNADATGTTDLQFSAGKGPAEDVQDTDVNREASQNGAPTPDTHADGGSGAAGGESVSAVGGSVPPEGESGVGATSGFDAGVSSATEVSATPAEPEYVPYVSPYKFLDQVDQEYLTALIDRSKKFHDDIYFPSPRQNSVDSLLLDAGFDYDFKVELLKMMRGTRPILSSLLIKFIDDFINIKLESGTEVEKRFYNEFCENLTTAEERARAFASRVMTKRPMVFYLACDEYTLKNGVNGRGGFEDIVNNTEETVPKTPLLIKDYISYDEMPISALVSASVPTFFINSGSRTNYAQKSRVKNYQEKGIYTGCVGARLEKPGVMEWVHMVITPEQNTEANGYGRNAPPSHKRSILRLWAALYNMPDGYFPTYAEVMELKSTNEEAYRRRYTPVDYSPNQIFSKQAYSARMLMSVEPYLLDANDRAKEEGKMAHCVVVGLGLGVWKLTNVQTELLVQTYADVLNNTDLSNIGEITFSWFDVYQCGGTSHGQNYQGTNNNHIRINFTRGDPAVLLPDPNQLLVAQYAWDGNAYPGNEYWRRQFAASGDPAAACCSLISEFQHPIINADAFQAERVKFFGSTFIQVGTPSTEGPTEVDTSNVGGEATGGRDENAEVGGDGADAENNEAGAGGNGAGARDENAEVGGDGANTENNGAGVGNDDGAVTATGNEGEEGTSNNDGGQTNAGTDATGDDNGAGGEK